MKNVKYNFEDYTIVSGGQTGADIAGLQAARSLKFKTGGWAPKDWETTDGNKEAELRKYGLTEHAGGYRPRTIQNVKDSDITVIVSRKWNSPGTILTMNACKRASKPFIALREDGSVYLVDRLPELQVAINKASKVKNDDDMDMTERTLTEIAKTLVEYQTINVAGNAENNAPGIEDKAYNLFYEIFWRMNQIINQ
jgi:hypothetical protein